MDDTAVELTTFTTVGDGYVYAPLPAATSYGHRAELWNPDKWMQEVKIKVVTSGDHCFVRMLTKEAGELFAECPLPADGTPLTTAVEPVVDSSRYFVVKIVDRESRKHAFVGIGFRDRMDASDFTAALDDYRQYLRRKQEAEQLRQEFDTMQAPSSSGSKAAGEQQGEDGSSAPQRVFSLKPGETIHIKLSPSLKRGDSGKAAAGAAASILRSGSGGSSSPAGAAPGAVPRLAPPGSSSKPTGSSSSSATGSSSSSSGFFRLQPPPPASSTAAGSVNAASQQQAEVGAAAEVPAKHILGPGRASLGEGIAPAEDDWGDFVG